MSHTTGPYYMIFVSIMGVPSMLCMCKEFQFLKKAEGLNKVAVQTAL